MAATAPGCATPAGGGAPGAPSAEAPAAVPGRVRSAPADDDLVGLVPAGTESLLEIRMAALRESPWSRGVLDATPAEERRARVAARGFDEIADVDRLLLASVAGSKADATLTIAQGRFDRARVLRAFRDGAPAAANSGWRGIDIWHDDDRAIAFVTARTFLAGPLLAVRAALDCAFGVVPDVRTDVEMGEVRRAVEGTGEPALRLAVIVSDEMRARLRRELGTTDDARTDGLRRVGGRLDVGHDLALEVIAFTDGPASARALADDLLGALRGLRGRPALAALGLAELLAATRIDVQGARILASLRVGEARREEIARRFAAVAEALAGAGAR